MKGGMHLGSWSSALVLAALAVAPGCVSQSRYDKLVTEYNAELQARRQLEDEMGRHEGEVSDLAQQLASKDEQFSQLQSAAQLDKSRIVNLQNDLQKALSEAQKSFPAEDSGDGVEILRTRDGFAYRIADQLLFASGSTEVRNAGKQALLKIAKEINDKGYRNVRIDGHTDADPVKRTLEKFPLGNQQLAVERALAVFAVLSEDGKVPESAFTIVGFGPNAPVTSEKSDGAKAKNRRVEIHIAVPAKN
jgi:flagellar motor protein MotB